MKSCMIQARAGPELPLAQDPLAQDHPLIHHQALTHIALPDSVMFKNLSYSSYLQFFFPIQ